jgi:hypothetical protein
LDAGGLATGCLAGGGGAVGCLGAGDLTAGCLVGGGGAAGCLAAGCLEAITKRIIQSFKIV